MKKEIKDLKNILSDKSKIYSIIIKELSAVAKEYASPRKSLLVYPEETEDYNDIEIIPDYPVKFFMTNEGYFKKIIPQSLKMNSEQKLKSDDEIFEEISGSNHSDLLFFTNKCQVYKAKGYMFSDTKSSAMGEYIPAVLSFEKNEKVIYMAVTTDYSGFMLFFFKSGKISKIEMKSYYTKTNRKKLIKAYTDKDDILSAIYMDKDDDFLLTSSSGKILIFNSHLINLKQTKNAQGVAVMKQKKGHKLIKTEKYLMGTFNNEKIYCAKNIPAAGKLPSGEEINCEQLTLI